MPAYYNEHDPEAAAWLRELIKAGHIAAGEVDERSIAEVRADDLAPFTQCHFFAGIGGWSLALRLGGWPDERPVWTGSCPCQPFSAAGKQRGADDERHLWPVFRELIRAAEPAIVFGEQVASALGRQWLAGVFADLEGMEYQRAGADLRAAGVRAPHIRQRLWWMAYAEGHQCSGSERNGDAARRGGLTNGGAISGPAITNGGHASAERQQRSGQQRFEPQDGGTRGLADSEHDGRRTDEPGWGEEGREADGRTGGMGDTSGARLAQQRSEPGSSRDASRAVEGQAVERTGASSGPWSDFDLLPCTDGKTRRIEPGSFPLAHGIPGRVGLLRGYGNAIVPELAAEFIQAAQEAIGL